MHWRSECGTHFSRSIHPSTNYSFPQIYAFQRREDSGLRIKTGSICIFQYPCSSYIHTEFYLPSYSYHHNAFLQFTVAVCVNPFPTLHIGCIPRILCQKQRYFNVDHILFPKSFLPQCQKSFWSFDQLPHSLVLHDHTYFFFYKLSLYYSSI